LTGSTGTNDVRPGSRAAAVVGGAVRAALTVTCPVQLRAAAVASALARVSVYAPGLTGLPRSSRRSQTAASGTVGDAVPVRVRTTVPRHTSVTCIVQVWSLVTRAVVVIVPPLPYVALAGVGVGSINAVPRYCVVSCRIRGSWA
jgi:hypothetical protein